MPYVSGQLAAAVARRLGLYTLMQRLRTLALASTEFAHAQAATIWVKLLKIGASVIRNSRRIRILLASHLPERETFLFASRALAP
ncbi:MAG: transposase [Methylococcaceae bacterium]|nr:transposase [Methylococcaceae bacterium]